MIFALLIFLPLLPNGRATPSCVIPNTTVCSINYSVPASVALIAQVFEMEIQVAFLSDVGQGNSGACAQSLKEVRCARSFPRCSNDFTKVTVTSLDCEQRVTCLTSVSKRRLEEEGFCNLTEKTLPLEGCKPASGYGYAFRTCPTNNVRVTDWMFELLRYEDVYLSSTNVLGSNSSYLATNYPSCSSGYARYHCSKAGQCDPNGGLIVNSYYNRSQCQNTLNCYLNSGINLYCDFWPNSTFADTTTSQTPVINGTGNTDISTTTPVPKTPTTLPPVSASSQAVSGEETMNQSIELLVTMLVCTVQSLELFYN